MPIGAASFANGRLAVFGGGNANAVVYNHEAFLFIAVYPLGAI